MFDQVFNRKIFLCELPWKFGVTYHLLLDQLVHVTLPVTVVLLSIDRTHITHVLNCSLLEVVSNPRLSQIVDIIFVEEDGRRESFGEEGLPRCHRRKDQISSAIDISKNVSESFLEHININAEL